MANVEASIFDCSDYDREQFAENPVPLLLIGTKFDQIPENKRSEVLTRTAFLSEDFNAEEINLVSRLFLLHELSASAAFNQRIGFIHWFVSHIKHNSCLTHKKGNETNDENKAAIHTLTHRLRFSVSNTQKQIVVHNNKNNTHAS